MQSTAAKIKTDYLDYKSGTDTFEGFVAYDESKSQKRPAVVICHAWAGQMDPEREIAQKLAELGYLGFAADVYGKGVRGDIQGDNSNLMMPLLENRSMLKQRLLDSIKAAAEHPMSESNKVAAIGYCFGGLCVLDLARANAPVQGVVSFHGLFSPPDWKIEKQIKPKILILHGWDDPMATPQNVLEVSSELSLSNADWQLHGYGGAMHAFTNPAVNNKERGTVYNETAAKRSWQAMENFLTEIF
ncbi:MAG: dienelactone hydrolase family protein [Candidatus Melainabacteria bacterium]|nr:dienelactone hydrolase family protein [Candidatus Melainabacteria bacterium]